jgi:EmrB/QacA subfamily drug resistance transporter
MSQSRAYKNRWIALVFMGFALLVISLDNTVLNLALPSIARDLGSSSSGLQWIIDSYVLVIAGLLLTMGYIGDRIGRKPMLLGGLAIFGLFSLGAALSNSTGMLIGMRALMAVGAAVIMPATLSILTATFRDPKERSQAIAIWAAVFALGMGIGPLVGGWLLDHFHWSSVFYINLPIVFIGIAGSAYYITNSKASNPRKLDYVGSVVSIAGLFALVYGIIQAGQDGWTASHVLWAFGAAVVVLTFFIIWELRSPSAMLPIHFFKNMSFTGANVALTMISFAMMGVMFFMSLYFQTVLKYTPFEAGVRMLPMAACTFVASFLSAKVANFLGTKVTVAIGISLASAGFFYLAAIASVDTTYTQILIAMIITSLGMGLTMSPATNSVMGSIPVDQSGVGSAMNNTTRQVGAALGVAVLGSLLNSNYIASINSFNWPAQVPEKVLAVVRSSVQGAHVIADKLGDPQLGQMIISQANQAFVQAASRTMLISAIIVVAAAVVSLIILPNRVHGPQAEQVKKDSNRKLAVNLEPGRKADK